MPHPRLRIVAPDDFPRAVAGHPALGRLADVAEVRCYNDRADSAEALAARIAPAHAIFNIRAFTRIDDALLECAPELRLIAVFGTGYDNVDLTAATRRGVLVTNAPGANARSVAEHTLALLLATVRHVARSDRDVRAGDWRHHETMELEGKTLGVLGLGAIGSRVARMGAALEMRVLAWSRTADPTRAAACGVTQVGLRTLLRESDAVCVCVASTPETRGLLDAAALATMKPGAVLINTARGAVIDERALLDALHTGHLGGAGLDVFDAEPLPADHPLRAFENVTLTPHSGWVSRESRDRTVEVPVSNILAYLAGTPQNVVNPEALTHAQSRSAVASSRPPATRTDRSPH